MPDNVNFGTIPTPKFDKDGVTLQVDKEFVLVGNRFE